jgi:hypothetical protein
MKRVRLVSAKHVELEEFSPQEPKEGQVRLQVKFCGICGSDVHAYFNKHPFIKLPMIPGHECARYMGLVQDREITIKGSLMYLHEAFYDALSLLVRGSVKARPLVTRVLNMDRVEEAFNTAAALKRGCDQGIAEDHMVPSHVRSNYVHEIAMARTSRAIRDQTSVGLFFIIGHFLSSGSRARLPAITLFGDILHTAATIPMELPLRILGVLPGGARPTRVTS